MADAPTRYAQILERIFQRNHSPGARSVEFSRSEIETVAAELGVQLPKNLGDLIYSFRFRVPLPAAIKATAPEGQVWVIRLAGRGRYRFQLLRQAEISPTPNLVVTKIPDATPEIIASHTLGDEQAVLARIRYNRLIDIFLGVTAYSLQNHLRTTVPSFGQVEIDEVYVAVDRHGSQYAIPVQAKGGTDRLGVVQTEQDVACCAQKFPDLVVRPVAAQFMADGVICLFELTEQEGEIRVVQERHYQLVAADEIGPVDLELYQRAAATGG